MKKIEVVAAILINENKILCVQRAESKLPYISKKFEFPGGKIAAGETKKEALQRELVEELDINVKVGDLYLTVNHQYPDFELTMHSFIVKVESRKLTLNEHIDQKWLSKEELTALDWAVADLPIVHKLISND